MNHYIKDDSPQDVAPATPEERQAILDKLSEHMTPDRVATLDGVSKRGTMKKGKLLKLVKPESK